MTGTLQEIETERAEAQAADWLVRLQSGEFVDADARALEAWLETPAHRSAFARAEALWLDLEEAAALERAPVAPLPRGRPRARPNRRWPLAAGLALAASLAGLAVFFPRSPPPPAPAVYQAARGEHRQLRLADGTRIHLGGGSRLVVAFDRSARRVELASADGEAAFDVAKDPALPFVIRAGDRSITVVGTEFDVRRAAGRLVVTVRRGMVEVAALAPGSRPVRLAPGQEFSGREGDSEARVATVDPAVAFGWTKGERTYRDQALTEVVADLNRYFPIPLQVDATAADLRFTGFLRIDEEDAVVRRLQAFLPITAVRSGEVIILRHGPG